jgi:tRNA dimethylallyltransferase
MLAGPGLRVSDSPGERSEETRSALVICGPTAAGKSSLADRLGRELSNLYGAWVTTIVVDSMQVYREIPTITNQARARPAEMVGIVSVGEEWTVARHRKWAEEKIDALPPQVPFVLDAGTGMYLNALVLDVPLAPRVRPHTRAEAERLALASGAENPRRETRRRELELAGAQPRSSIWEGTLRYDATFVYLRPETAKLDQNIRARSSGIVREGVEEAEGLMESGIEPNPSVREAIGVREMLLHVLGGLSAEEAQEKISTRTRRLARRQIRWFDKLASSLPGTTALLVVEDPQDQRLMHFMHDRMWP